MSAAASAQRTPVDVAVGLMVREDGQFLLASRPQGKPYAGYWEFPGGKLEAGEDVIAALGREFEEELGITIHEARPWRTMRMDYPHALVDLHVCWITGWDGEPQPCEGQGLAWSRFPVTVSPLLPGAWPLLAWIAEERGYLGPVSAVESPPNAR